MGERGEVVLQATLEMKDWFLAGRMKPSWHVPSALPRLHA